MKLLRRIRLIPLVIAAFALANPVPLFAQGPMVALPVEINAAGTASRTISANSCIGFSAAPQAVTAQLRVTINGQNYDFAAGMGWSMNSPTGARFSNALTLTALVGKFTISTIR